MKIPQVPLEPKLEGNYVQVCGHIKNTLDLNMLFHISFSEIFADVNLNILLIMRQNQWLIYSYSGEWLTDWLRNKVYRNCQLSVMAPTTSYGYEVSYLWHIMRSKHAAYTLTKSA